MSLESRLKRLQDRAKCLASARVFFAKRGIIEVDTPLLSHYAPIDEHIDVIQVNPSTGERGYLHTSPEYAMKRLLAEGMGDIYFLGHVFRQGEVGKKHNPEFTMAEWYRKGFTFEQMIEETVEFIRLFLGNIPYSTKTYREVLLEYTGLDYVSATCEEICSTIKQFEPTLNPLWMEEDKDSLLQLLLHLAAEPYLGKDHLFVLTHYPATQAALAKTMIKPDGEQTALRFEVYFQGVELANGYDELANPSEQRSRFIQAQEKRKEKGKDPLHIDEYFLQALEKGMPACTGVAVGFDRLLMLKHQVEHIKEVIPFSWEEV